MFRFAALALVVFAAPARTEDSVAVLKAQLEVKQAHVKVAEATLAAAKRSHSRLEQLRTQGGPATVSVLDCEKAKDEVDLAQAQLTVKQAEVREAEARLKDREGEAKPAAGAKIALFNMDAVLLKFDKARYHSHLYHLRRNELVAPLQKKREELVSLQKDISEETDLKKREKQVSEYQAIQQKYADEEAELSKKLNDEISKYVSEIHDDVESVVKRIATAEGLVLVLAYPDAVSEEEKRNSYLKEVKLKPAAAQPFFVAKEMDITAAIIKKLNADHPALDKDGKKVDVSKLPPAVTPTTPPGKKP
jgi:Skp family chaperone for outer membrane proteins